MIDTWLDSLTPRTVRRWAVRALIGATPVTVAAFIARAAGLFPEGHEATMLMTFLGGLVVAAVSVTVAVMATIHMRVALAFTAGFRAGQLGDRFEDMPSARRLTVVE